MSQIIIGKANGRNIGFDIPELLVSRLLITANSGGGKSFLLRRILEQAYGKVQQIVIDPAGEFATLREKYGFVLVGEQGETPADVRSAGLVAEKLLELRASAVCDLYSLKPTVRHTWVKLFLTAVMNAPKKLWHPVLFEIDEAHKFCPENGEGESEAKEAMLSLASDGRKYGFCAVWATQRLAKLDKSAASELNNVLVGPTFLDVDLKRAHKALGIATAKEQNVFNEQMKTIRPGNFWALGRAISKHRVLVKIGDVETTHPQAGSGKYSAEPPPPPEKIKALLPKLADLPKAAEEKARTEAEFKREIRELKHQLSVASRQSPAQTAATKEVAVKDPLQARVIRDQDAMLTHLRAALEDAMKVIARVTAFGFEATKINPKQLEAAVQKAVEEVGRQISLAGDVRRKEFEQLKREVEALMKRLERVLDKKLDVKVDVVRAQPPFVLGPSTQAQARPAHSTSPTTTPSPRASREPLAPGEVRLGNLHRQIAGILAGYHPQPVSITLLAAMCGRAPGGSWSARLSELRNAGLLADAAPGLVLATESCVQQYLGTFQPPSNTQEALALWDSKLPTLHKQILERLIEARGEPVAIDDLAAAVGRTPGGSFSARLSEIRAKNLLVDPRRGFVAANRETLFLEDSAA